MVLSLLLSTAKPEDAFATTETVADQKTHNMIVMIPSSFVPTMNSASIGLKCINVITPVIANEKAEQKTAHVAFEEDAFSEFFCVVKHKKIIEKK
mmetsp:Transcript_16507/g.45489  ORF Transcript_16507/g.45489 Transcript_16507/m.45489 type:complete len:95 (-) Transcript_16507:385-669(-)